jgi:photosystem II stability/assembly factor-like uncharacterized protein
MAGAHLGWAVGAYAIFSTSDGVRWTKQFASTEQFVGLDFITASTGWAVGVRTLMGTKDGGRSWQALGEPTAPLRSVHFVSASQGWGVAGGSNPAENHAMLLPEAGASLVTSTNGGLSWTALQGPDDPQSVCFSDPSDGWLATSNGFIYKSGDAGKSWTKVFQVLEAGTGVGLRTLLQCAAPSALWAYTTIDNGATGHLPYVVYATQDGSQWRTVMAEPVTAGNLLPGVPAGPDSHPGSFSVIDPSDAVFIGDGPATNLSQCVIASNSGTTLHRTGSIANSSETFGAAFINLTSGWVLTRNIDGDYVIDATADGGYHWSQQLAVTPSSAG